MKKYFFIALGITAGVVLSLAIIGSGIYWWLEVRIPEPPDVSVDLEGFPDARVNENGKHQPLVRILVTNNSDTKLSISDAYLYLTRVSDGARTDFGYEVGDIIIYPKEKYVEVVEAMPTQSEWIDYKDTDTFESEQDYLAYKKKWVSQIKEKFKFNFSFVSDTHNIRILLDTQEKIKEIENKNGWVQSEYE
jgi:hypothetical protein